MKSHNAKLDISRLREIGWSKWNPIGLLDIGVSWKGQPFEDEYDTYLIKAAGMLRGGSKNSEVVDYLYFIETEYMGLGLPTDIPSRKASLLVVVNAISNDTLIWRDAGE